MKNLDLLNIPKDTKLTKADGKIRSGTFDFWGVNTKDPNDKLHFTEGRFDIKEP